MATDIIITLERLNCFRESDRRGHSEPYIWPVLLRIDRDTLATPPGVASNPPLTGNARQVIKKDMRAGQSADISPGVGLLRLRVENTQDLNGLILVVALLEEDETPKKALQAGFLVFFSELCAAVGENLFALKFGSEEEKEAIKAAIKARVQNKVEFTIEDNLTGWQKAEVLSGLLNMDDFIDSATIDFSDNIVPQSFSMAFTHGTSDAYEIQGNLQLRPVLVDRCQAEVNAVNEAQILVNSVNAEIAELQKALKTAPPNEKPGILDLIQQLRDEDLPIAQGELDKARTALSNCRSRVPPFFPDTANPEPAEVVLV